MQNSGLTHADRGGRAPSNIYASPRLLLPSSSLWGNSAARPPDRPFIPSLPFRDVDMNSAVGVSASAYSYIYATAAVEHPFPSLVAHSPAFSLALSVLPSLNDVITKVAGGGRREEGTSEARCRDTLDSGVIARARWRREGLRTPSSAFQS